MTKPPAQIAMFDLFKSYCTLNFPEETLLLIENFEVELGDEVPDLNGITLLKEHFSDIEAKPLTIITSVVMVYEIKEEDISKILGRAHDEKWGWGDSVYVWKRDKLMWGKD